VSNYHPAEGEGGIPPVGPKDRLFSENPYCKHNLAFLASNTFVFMLCTGFNGLHTASIVQLFGAAHIVPLALFLLHLLHTVDI